MQLVIELTDEQWKCVQDGTWCGTKEILNGIPLPKGHGRLIDEQDAIDTLSVMFSGNDEILNDALECIEQLPEIIEADGGDAE